MILRSLRCPETWLILVASILGLALVSCESTYNGDRERAIDPISWRDPPPSSTGAQRGEQLFQTVGCIGCHTVHGQGGQVGPDLSNEGNASRSRSWLRTQIRDPKSHDPQTSMPAFPKLSDQQVNDLVDYLESLKTGQTQAGQSRAVPAPGADVGSAAMMGRPSLVATGAKLWGRTCGEYHNLLPPSEYSDAQWEVAIRHMRVRVPLTGQEQRDILAFLQATN